jgi:hypothetical protein
LKHRDDIIDDRTNLTIGSRRKKLSQVPKEYHKVAVTFTLTDENIWLRGSMPESARTFPSRS